ncbi:MAG: DNA-binding protein, partial [Oscillospiraceae bacterium]|nr:DNA-binding protein [Oscillospiraceae bacterium]
DMIDGILMEEKKEVDKVILSSKELSPFFGNDKTPREMKDTILKLLNEHKEKNPPELGKTDKPVKPPER